MAVSVAVLVSSDSTVNELASVGGLLVGLAGLAIPLAQLPSSLPPPPRVEELADLLAVTVRDQWEEEATVRQLRLPRVIPLTWSATRRPVVGLADAVLGPVGARVLRMSMNGRLDGGFDEAVTGLAAGYRSVSSGRLVVLGEPGAGKTVLALMLTLGLLRDRNRDPDRRDPVPVLLSVSTWDPVSESLDDWIVGTVAVSYYGGREDIPRRLLAARLLLPVLDGLDEIPETARRSAVRAVNHACGDGRGIVVTCRSVEYEDVIEGGSPVLRRAPVVEIAPVSVTDAAAYLADISWPADVDWEPVHDRLRTDPAGPLAAALSTPLSLSLARTVYWHCRRDPAELLTFDSRHAVEDHLVDHVITAAYAPPPGTVEQPGDHDAWQQRAEDAEKWLTYLATYLHRNRERDLAWWQMSRQLLTRWSGIALGLAVGLLMMIAVIAATPALDPHISALGTLPGACAIGAGLAILTMLTWYGAPDRPPGRLSFAARGSLGRLRHGAANALLLVAILALPLLATAAVVITLTTGWSAHLVATFAEWIAAGTGGGAAFALTLAVHNWLDAPPERSTGASPLGLLRQDRTSTLAGSAIAAAVLGLTAIPFTVLGLATGWTALNALAGASHQSPPTTAIASFASQGHFFSRPLTSAASTLLPMAVFATLILTTRAWPRFALLRLVLASRGRLPWHLVHFLADARDRQLLRQTAGTYQFRHIRLQERLASRSLTHDREPAPRALTVRRRRVQAALAGAAALGACFALAQALPKDTSHDVLPTGHVDHMTFSPNGRTLVTISGREARWWNVDTGRQIRRRTLPTDIDQGSPINAVAVAGRTDGQLVLVTNVDSSRGQFLRWDWVVSPSRTSTINMSGLKGSDSMIDTGPVLTEDGAYAVTVSDDVVDIVSTDSRATAVSYTEPPDLAADQGGAQLLSLSNDQRRLLSSTSDGRLWVTDLLPGRQWDDTQRLTNSETPGGPAAMSGDGRRFAVAQGNAVQPYDYHGRPTGGLLTGSTSSISTITLSRNGSTVAASASNTTRVWKLTPTTSTPY